MEHLEACHASSALEKVLEHRFVAELSSTLWQHGIAEFEVLRSEVDRHGYDLVIEAGGIIRHIQLKALRQGGKRSAVALNTRLAGKPSGCVVWMIYDPASLTLGPFLWFGGRPGEPLPDLGNRIARHTKGNAQGTKSPRPDHRLVRKSAFQVIETMEELSKRLFGDTQGPMQSPGAAMVGSGAIRRNGGAAEDQSGGPAAHHFGQPAR